MLNNFKGIKCPGRDSSANRQKKFIFDLQNGDLDSFGPIYSRFKKPILKYVLMHIKAPSVAEELTQDVFLKIYQYRKSYNPQFVVSTWIWTIARNTLYDYLR